MSTCNDKVADSCSPEATLSYTEEDLTSQAFPPDLATHESKKTPTNTQKTFIGSTAVMHTGVDWTEVYNELNNSIKMRHYSPKRLKTYTG